MTTNKYTTSTPEPSLETANSSAGLARKFSNFLTTTLAGHPGKELSYSVAPR
jgi:hypothetical protein